MFFGKNIKEKQGLLVFTHKKDFNISHGGNSIDDKKIIENIIDLFQEKYDILIRVSKLPKKIDFQNQKDEEQNKKIEEINSDIPFLLTPYNDDYELTIIITDSVTALLGDETFLKRLGVLQIQNLADYEKLLIKCFKKDNKQHYYKLNKDNI